VETVTIKADKEATMRSILFGFFMAIAFAPSAIAWEIDCPSYDEVVIDDYIFMSYEPGIWIWSVGYKETCPMDGICVIENWGTDRRLFDLRTPIHFISSCLDKNIDFCSPMNYNIPCINYTFEDQSSDCGA
jgi:hypothetical protein